MTRYDVIESYEGVHVVIINERNVYFREKKSVDGMHETFLFGRNIHGDEYFGQPFIPDGNGGLSQIIVYEEDNATDAALIAYYSANIVLERLEWRRRELNAHIVERKATLKDLYDKTK